MSSPDIEIETRSESDKTPKAHPVESKLGVPTLTLSDDNSIRSEDDDGVTNVPMFPAPNSAQRARKSRAIPAADSKLSNSADIALMPPPPPPITRANQMPPPARPLHTSPSNPVGKLRVPSSGPLPNRAPPANSQRHFLTDAVPNNTSTSSSQRAKVELSPGHSPMDWAALTRTGDLSGVSTFQRVTPSRLRTMTGRKGKPAWSSFHGRSVYNISPYLPFHPGGEAELLKAAGRDGTKLFTEVHPWVNWENMLHTCLVGIMVPEDDRGSSLEDLD